VRLLISRSRHFSLALVAFISITLFELRDLQGKCAVNSVGLFGDAYGTMWVNWVQNQQGFPPWKNTTQFVGYPFGENFWTFPWFTSILIRFPQYIVSELFGAICGYNIMVAFGMIFTSLCAWGLVYWLTKNQILSLLAGFMFGFGPFMQSAITGHINYVFIGVYPLLIYLIFRLKERSTFGRIATGLILGAYSYIDGYYLIPVATSIVFYFIFELFRSFKHFSEDGTKLSISWSFYFSFAMAQLPLFILLKIELASTNFISLPKRDWNELSVYSLKWWHLLSPSPTNMYFGHFYNVWQTERLGGSNFSETGLYAGSVFITVTTILLIKGLLKLLKVRKLNFLDSRPSKKKIIFLFAFLFLGLLLPMRPWVHFFEIRVPFPSGILFHIFPYWRTISRWGILATISIIAIGSIGIADYLKDKSKRIKTLVLPVLIFAVLLDVGVPGSLSPKVEQVTEQSGPYNWVAQNTAQNSVLLDVVPFSVDNFFTGLALTSKRRLVNTINPPSKSIQKELLFPGYSSFTCAVNFVGADYLIIHPRFYNEKKFPEIVGLDKIWENKNFELDRLRDWNYAAIYKSDKSKNFRYLANFSSDFKLVSNASWGGNWQLTSGKGIIEITPAVKKIPTQPILLLKSKIGNQSIKISLNDQVIHEFFINDARWNEVELPKMTSQIIKLEILNKVADVEVKFSNIC